MPVADTWGWPPGANNALLLFDTTNDTVCVSPAPALIAVAQLATFCAAASSFTAWSSPFVKLGASLTPLTVMVNVCGALVLLPSPLSCNATVTVAMPEVLAAG